MNGGCRMRFCGERKRERDREISIRLSRGIRIPEFVRFPRRNLISITNRGARAPLREISNNRAPPPAAEINYL